MKKDPLEVLVRDFTSQEKSALKKSDKKSRSDKMLGNQNHRQYLDCLDAIKYLVANNVYIDEWTGAGMYEAIVKIAPSKRVKISYLKQLLEEASNF